MKKLKKIIGNKYLLAGIAFGLWMLFFDRNDIPLQIKRMHHLNQLQKSEKLMIEKIANTETELQNLKNNPETLEKYARENYLMKKPNEDLFIFEPATGK